MKRNNKIRFFGTFGMVLIACSFVSYSITARFFHDEKIEWLLQKPYNSGNYMFEENYQSAIKHWKSTEPAFDYIGPLCFGIAGCTFLLIALFAHSKIAKTNNNPQR